VKARYVSGRQEEKVVYRDSPRKLQKLNALLKRRKREKKREEYKLLNGMLFLSFILPAIFAIIVGLPMNFFYLLVVVWVHEAGHGFWCLFGSRLLCSFGGMLNEMLFTAVPALICFRQKEIYLAGCVLLMCAGMSIQHNGVYMQSAANPYGMTSFAGALTRRYGDMTEQSHDWSVIFGGLGVIENSYRIGRFTEEIGHTITVIFFTASIWALALILYGRYPTGLGNLVGGGALASAIYFFISGAGVTEILLSLLLSVPVLKKLILSIS